ncbi:hypothetical protein V8F20_006017 [Naviculisporaceae sp. PSN 640]
MNAGFAGQEKYSITGNYQGNSASGFARVHQGPVINVYQNGGGSEPHPVVKLLYTEYVRGKDRNRPRTKGTCQWVLGNEKFIRWRENPSAAALWISAEPGSGKSVLSRALVDDCLVRSQAPDQEKAAICYFFFKDDDASQNNAQSALCALLYQIFEFWRKPAAIRHAISQYQRMGQALRSSLDQLWSIFEAVTQDPETGPVICVLDALDECEETGRDDLIEKITGFIQRETGSPKRVKFVMTSRPYPEIDGALRRNIRDLDTINLRPDEDSYTGISSEINIVIEERVREVFRGCKHPPSEDTQRLFINKLQAHENRTYLWVSLVLKDLARTRRSREEDLHAFLEQLPQDVEAAYQKLLGRILPQVETEVRTLFHILLVSERPLTLQEMDIALAIGTGRLDAGGALEDLRLMGTIQLEEHIQMISYSFVNVVGNHVYFLHQTAREFLICHQTPICKPSPPSRWKCCFDPQESNMVIAKICMIYLLAYELNRECDLSVLVSNPDCKCVGRHQWWCPLVYWSRHLAQPREKLFCDFPFLSYASTYWVDHYRRCNFDDDRAKSLISLAAQLCCYPGPSKQFIAMDLDLMEFLNELDILHLNEDYMLEFGHQAFFSEEWETAHLKEKTYPLAIAVKLNQVVQFLLDRGAGSDVAVLWYLTRLAVRNVEDALVSRLIIARLPTEMRRQAFMISVEENNVEFAESLIVCGLIPADSDSLLVALEKCRLDPPFQEESLDSLIYLILESGVNPNVVDRHGRPAVIIALEHRDIWTLECLLEHKANPNQRGSDGKVPLMVALENWVFDGIDRLLDAGAEIELLEKPWQVVVRFCHAIALEDWNLAEVAMKELCTLIRNNLTMATCADAVTFLLKVGRDEEPVVGKDALEIWDGQKLPVAKWEKWSGYESRLTHLSNLFLHH